MKPARTLVTAIALLVAMFSVGAAPAFAEVVHAARSSAAHACCRPVKVTTGCCHVRSETSNPSSPAEDQVRLPTNSAAAVCAPPHAQESRTARTAFLVQTTPHAAPVDRCTLFACLLL